MIAATARLEMSNLKHPDTQMPDEKIRTYVGLPGKPFRYHTEPGEVRIGESIHELEASKLEPGHEVATSIGTAHVVKVDKSDGPKQMLAIAAANGYTTTVTADTMIPIYRKDQLISVEASRLVAGDRLVVDMLHEVIVDPVTKEALPFHFSPFLTAIRVDDGHGYGITIDEDEWIFADGIAVH